jgi:hypothetical protein
MNKTETIKRILNLTQLQQIEIKKLLPDLTESEFKEVMEIREKNKRSLEFFDSLI